MSLSEPASATSARAESGSLLVADANAPQRLRRALEDIELGLRRWRLPVALAGLDIRNRYRGSVLGPLWLTLSTAITFAALGVLYATLLKLDLHDYLPFLVVSLIIWNAIAQLVQEACTSLTVAEGIIRQMPLPYTVHLLRCVLRNGAVVAHNLPLILLVFLLFNAWPGWSVLLVLPGLLLVILNALAMVTFLGMFCARFRDIGPIVAMVMQLAFFVSPVLWKPELLGARQVWLVLNPFYDLMEVVRGPLLGAPPSAMVWAAATLITLGSCGFCFGFFVRFRSRIAFWV